MIYLVSYDVKNSRRDALIRETLLTISEAWWHQLSGVWLLNTQHNSYEIHNFLLKYFTEEDRLFIIRISNDADYNGYLPKNAWVWIEENMIKVG